jgi:hypothetical protein
MPDAADYRKLDLESDTYQRRFKPIPEIVQLLHEFGFQKPNESSPFLEYKGNDLRALDQAVVDLTDVIKTIQPHTPLYQTFQYLVANNDAELIVPFALALQQALKTIVEFPFEQKYRRINLQKFANKHGRLKSMARVFAAFGFEIDKEHDVAQLPPQTSKFDADLFRLKVVELNDFISNVRKNHGIYD